MDSHPFIPFVGLGISLPDCQEPFQVDDVVFDLARGTFLLVEDPEVFSGVSADDRTDVTGYEIDFTPES